MHLANFLLTQNSTNHSRLTLIVQDCFQALVVDSSYRDMRQSAMIVEYAKDKFLFWTSRHDLPCQCLPAFSREGYKLERCSEMQWVDCSEAMDNFSRSISWNFRFPKLQQLKQRLQSHGVAIFTQNSGIKFSSLTSQIHLKRGCYGLHSRKVQHLQWEVQIPLTSVYVFHACPLRLSRNFRLLEKQRSQTALFCRLTLRTTNPHDQFG